MASLVLRFGGQESGFLALWLLLWCAGAASARSCVWPCDTSTCATTSHCQYGTQLDLCACCQVCANGPGAWCGDYDGECGDGLDCVSDEEDGDTGTCTERAETTAPPPPTIVATKEETSPEEETSNEPSTEESRTTVADASTTINAETESSTPELAEAEPTENRPVVGCSQVEETVLQEDSARVEDESCRPECSVSFCSSGTRHRLCSAKGMAFPPVAGRGTCQHTSCYACFLHVETPCSAVCPDPPRKPCFKQFSNCIRNYIQGLNTRILRLEDPEAQNHTGRIVCYVPQLSATT